MKTVRELKFPGRLIAVEGLDGSGQTTQVRLLQRWLEAEGLKVFFSEWNSSELVQSAISRARTQELLTPTTFSLLNATDLADRYERQVLPLLRAGYVVLCDRYIFTAIARDTVHGCPQIWVRGLYDFAVVPDMTFFFNASLEVSFQRIADSRMERTLFEPGLSPGLGELPGPESFRLFQGKLQEQYLAMSREFSFYMIDANQPVEEQQEQVRQLVNTTVDLSRYQYKLRTPRNPAPRRSR